MSRWIITALPVVLLVFISLLNPGYTSRCSKPGAEGLALAIGAVLLVTWLARPSSGS